MAIVHGTVGNINPNSVCDDPACSQMGALMRDHVVHHKPKPGPKNQKGVCPFCGGKVHNVHDKLTTIIFDCQLVQALGVEQARKVTDLDAPVYDQILDGLRAGRIKEWATRDKLEAILKGASGATAPTTTTPAPGPTAPAPTTSTPPAAAPTPAAPAPASAPPVPSAPAPVPPVQAPRQTTTTEDQRRKMAAILRGSKALP